MKFTTKMTDSKSEIVVYQGSDRAGLVARGEPVTARNAPAIVKAAGRSAEFAWEEFFQARSPTPTPARTTCTPSRSSSPGSRSAAWSCRRITPGDVGDVPPGLDLSVPTKKLHLAALRTLLRPAGQPPRLRHQPGGDRQGRALRRRRGQDARDRPRAGPHAAQVDRRLEPGGSPGPGHPGGARLHGRPRRRRRQADPQEPQARRVAVYAPILRERRQVPRDPGAARPGGDSCWSILRPPRSPRAASSARRTARRRRSPRTR